jgi:hypothetical protein
VVGRVVLNNGFGVQNAKVSIFIPIKPEDKERPEIYEIYPFETPQDALPNGVRYNLLPRTRNGRNPSHKAVGNFPDVTDLTNYPQYLEVFENYYKYTTITNDSGDYMIFGVPLGAQNIIMDFDVFDTKSFEVTANDLVAMTTQNQSIADIERLIKAVQKIDIENKEPDRVPGFVYEGDGNYEVELKTNLNEMPNIFNEVRQINVSPFWGDKELYDIGITRCDFNINFKLQPTAIFFGHLTSTTNTFNIKSDYTFSMSRKPEVFARDTQLDYDTGDIFPLQDFDIVIYKLDEKNNEGSRKRVGTFKGAKGTGFFRLTLPMYLNYFTTNEYGDLIPSDDPNIGIPTQGNYAFEIYETNDAWRGTRNVWGGYDNSIIPGIRIPATSTGDKWLGGWEGTTGGIFQYDLFNKKRKFYTISTTYRKHNPASVLLEGEQVSYFPTISPHKADAYWNFPIDYRDTSHIEEPTVIGGCYIPRVQLKYDKGTKQTLFPSSLLLVPYKPKEQTFETKIEDYEWFLGIGTQLQGINSGKVFDDLFSGTDFMVTKPDGSKKSIYGEIETFFWGDNFKDKQIKASLYAIELSQKQNATANEYSVHTPYTQAISDFVTSGVFVNSSDYQMGKVKLFEIGLYDITDELQDLIVNRVYTSYKKSSTDASTTLPGDGSYHLQNQYNGKYYFFGYWKGMNALYDIEKNYFNVIS